MGHAGCSNMSTLSQCCCWCHRQPILYHHAPMVCFHMSDITFDELLMVTALINRSWPTPVMLKQIDEGPLPVRVWNPKVRLEDAASLDFHSSSLPALSLGSSPPDADYHTCLSFHVCHSQRDLFHANDYDSGIQDRSVSFACHSHKT